MKTICEAIFYAILGGLIGYFFSEMTIINEEVEKIKSECIDIRFDSG